MAKRSSRSRGKEKRVVSKKGRAREDEEDAAAEDMDDEIDAFHKKREVVPLNVHGDAGDSDDDDEEPVFDFQEEEDDEEDKESEDDDVADDTRFTGLAAKIARQQKYLRAKMGGVEDEMHDDEEEDEENTVVWGRAKGLYYAADEPVSSDGDLPDEEEAEVLRLQKEKAKSFSLLDFGIDEVQPDERDHEPTLEEIKARSLDATKVGESSAVIEVEKDLNAMTKEEQMDVVYSSAPELVGLLSELNEAMEELDKKINPLLVWFKERGQTKDGGFRYVEVKQILLLAYCQAITFYLLLKSEGQPVRDHPVIARLVEIKNLLDKIRQLDENLPLQLEDILHRKSHEEITMQSAEKIPLPSDDENQNSESGMQPIQQEPQDYHESPKLQSKVDGMKADKLMHQSKQTLKMLEVRAALEEKLRNKIFSSTDSRSKDKPKLPKPANGRFETMEDFDDHSNEAVTKGLSNGHKLPPASTKIPSYVPADKKQKIVSGDDDLPKRDDVGERRRKHELRVLAGAGMNSEDDTGDGDNIDKEDTTDDEGVSMDASESGESDNDFYEQVKQQRVAKLAAKAEKYSRPAMMPSLPETVDGKRHITYQMEKNRGLTRKRKKDGKNPRSKYRKKHQKKMVARKGQVREIRKPAGPYGGESTGINAGISRSIRFKS